MVQILVVEDEIAIAHLIEKSLSFQGYHCTCAFDGEQAADFIEKNRYDLILLDIMLPKISGYELLDYIRPTGVPVIFITALGMLDDRIKGLRAGADDYIIKPFQIGELVARVEALLRRTSNANFEYNILGVYINTNSRQVKKDGSIIDLTVKEFDLLIELIKNQNVALYRSQLYERVWNEEFTGETRTLDLHIQHLRKKLRWDEHIKTVFRIGYRLEVHL